MSRVLVSLCVVLIIALFAFWVRIAYVTADRDAAQAEAKVLVAHVNGLLKAVHLQHQQALDQAAIEETYLKEKQSAEEYAESLRSCLADGACGLRVSATCVPVGGAGAAAGKPDAASPRLTPAAERAYPALVAGLDSQRAQIAGLQAELKNLHSKCKIGADQ